MIEGLKTPPLLLALLLSALAHALFVGGWWLGEPSSTVPASEPITIRLIDPAVPAPKPIVPPPIQSPAQPPVAKPTAPITPTTPTPPPAVPAPTPIATVQPTPVLTSAAPPLAPTPTPTPTVPASPQVSQVSQVAQAITYPVIESPRPITPAPAVITPTMPIPKPASRSDMAIVCPTQVKPIMPARAVAEGISGVVKAQVLIKDGAVKEVTIVSGPQVYRNAVRSALLQYKCITAGNDVIAEQSFDFKVE
jgi:protein TonB